MLTNNSDHFFESLEVWGKYAPLLNIQDDDIEEWFTLGIDNNTPERNISTLPYNKRYIWEKCLQLVELLYLNQNNLPFKILLKDKLDDNAIDLIFDEKYIHFVEMGIYKLNEFQSEEINNKIKKANELMDNTEDDPDFFSDDYLSKNKAVFNDTALLNIQQEAKEYFDSILTIRNKYKKSF